MGVREKGEVTGADKGVCGTEMRWTIPRIALGKTDAPAKSNIVGFIIQEIKHNYQLNIYLELKRL